MLVLTGMRSCVSVQVLYSQDEYVTDPILAAVGQLQFEVRAEPAGGTRPSIPTSPSDPGKSHCKAVFCAAAFAYHLCLFATATAGVCLWP